MSRAIRPKPRCRQWNARLCGRSRRCFACGGLQPPGLDEALKKDRRRKNLYHFLVEAGALVPTTERTSNRTIVFHRDAIAEAEQLPANGAGDGEGEPFLN